MSFALCSRVPVCFFLSDHGSFLSCACASHACLPRPPPPLRAFLFLRLPCMPSSTSASLACLPLPLPPLHALLSLSLPCMPSSASASLACLPLPQPPLHGFLSLAWLFLLALCECVLLPALSVSFSLRWLPPFCLSRKHKTYLVFR